MKCSVCPSTLTTEYTFNKYIDDFPDHPFKVRDDEDMMQLVESVKERGVITPATVRQKEDGRYELVSGRRRKRAERDVR